MRVGASNLGSNATLLMEQLDDGGRITKQEAAKTLEREAAYIGTPRRDVYKTTFGETTLDYTPGEADKANAKVLNDVAAILREQLAENKKQTMAIEKTGIQGSNH